MGNLTIQCRTKRKVKPYLTYVVCIQTVFYEFVLIYGFNFFRQDTSFRQ